MHVFLQAIGLGMLGGLALAVPLTLLVRVLCPR